MAASRVAFVVLVVVALVLAPPSPASAAVTCNQIYSALYPCLNYMMGGPCPPECCNGVRSLVQVVQTTPDKQTACGCLKAIAGSNPNPNGPYAGRAAALPNICQVNIPYNINPNVDCATIK